VPGAGIEPARNLAAPRDFKSRVSTKFHHPGTFDRLPQLLILLLACLHYAPQLLPVGGEILHMVTDNLLE
jgi:hypothetical protein